LERHNQINHIMRNGLVDIFYKARGIARNVDDILRRCKDMENALDKLDKEETKARNVLIDEPTGNERPFPV